MSGPGRTADRRRPRTTRARPDATDARRRTETDERAERARPTNGQDRGRPSWCGSRATPATAPPSWTRSIGSGRVEHPAGRGATRCRSRSGTTRRPAALDRRHHRPAELDRRGHRVTGIELSRPSSAPRRCGRRPSAGRGRPPAGRARSRASCRCATVPLAVTVSRPAGSRVAVRTGSADVTGDRAGRAAAVRTGSGNVHVDRVDGDAEVTTGSGGSRARTGTGRTRAQDGLRRGRGGLAGRHRPRSRPAAATSRLGAVHADLACAPAPAT